ncbi:high frequency lysogenization protein HflD [Thiomicrorhabdus sediminis]|uniref:High frequency lysogenization protein HflD homolog n=1 Tax=Thiomicrorhabdus sediminis TaxID=2580412 RepID=A0A4P9K5Q2_9GAMM|nr:high frequency lysogenization protein HflD [Thiomicrorhabdus sediminis]QCU90309.1 high frequency lysogenization protein HflD [Thiomicrorhabdus sediminis]
MSEYSQQDKTLALVGIYQCAQMVYELATTGRTDDLSYATSINTLFVENPQQTIDVYGGDIQNLQMGVNTLLSQMSTDQAVQNRNIEITRYVLNLMVLAKKIKDDGEALNRIFNTLETAKAQTEQFGEFHENVIATMARAYAENISPMSPRIMVNGQHGHLQNNRVANKIRTLLLAGIRSALLWYQVGGSRWGLLWARKKYLQSAQAMHRPDNSDDDSYFKKH